MRNKKRSLGSDAAFLSISKIINLFISLITGMLLSRFRTLEEYGTFSQIQMLVTFAVSFFMMGLPNSINYFLPQANTRHQKDIFFSTYFFSCTLMSLTAGFVLFLATSYFVVFFDNSKIALFSYAFLILPWTRIIISSLGSTLIVSNKTIRLTVYNVIHSLLMLGLIFLVKYLGKSFELYVTVYCSLEVMFALCVYREVFFLNNMEDKFCFDVHLLRKILVFSLPLGWAAVVGTLNIEIGKLVIGFFMGTEMLAVYANAGRELPFTVISSSITAVFMPFLVKLLSRNRVNDVVTLWGNTVELSYIIMCFFSTALFVFAPQVITLLYSEKYLIGVAPFRIYSLVLLWRTTYFGMMLNITGNSKLVLYASVATLLLNVTLVFVCYYFLGYIGPALAAFLSIGIIAILQLSMSSKVLKIRFSEIFPWRRLGNITLCNFSAGILVFFLKYAFAIETSSSDLLTVFIGGVLWMFLYISIMRKRIRTLWRGVNESEIVVENDG